MALGSRAWEKVRALIASPVQIHGRFWTNGASNPVDYIGNGYTVTYDAVGNQFVVTLDKTFPELVSMSLSLQVPAETDNEVWVAWGDIDESTGVFNILLRDYVAGVPAPWEPVADANSSVSFTLTFRDSSRNWPTKQ